MIAHNNQFVKKETKQKYSKNWPYDVKDGLNSDMISILINSWFKGGDALVEKY